jgi:hypothetical protein
VLSTLILLALSLADGDHVEDFEGAGSESWERIVSDGYPPYNIIERVQDPGQAKSGEQYLHFRTMGGSTAVRRSPRHPWAIEPGRPYIASAWIRLSGTRRNSAFLSLTWVGASGEVLAEQRSEPVAKADGWIRQALEIAHAPEGAVGVLPGLHFEGPDVRGVCDFDLLVMAPAELLEVRPAGRRAAMFAPDEYPRFVLRPWGLPPGVYAITATLSSADGKAVRRSATVEVPGQPSVAVDFPAATPGLYTLVAAVDQRPAARSLPVLITLPGRRVDEAPAPEPPARAGAEPPVTTLADHLREPRRPFAPDGGFFEADGTPTRAYYALRIVDRLLGGAEPTADPGFFPSTVRVAAFRKGASLAFALWSEGGIVRVPVLLGDGAVVQPLAGAPRALAPNEELEVGADPTFILDVDPLLSELRVELSASTLPLQLNPARLSVRFINRSRAEVARDVEVSLDGLPAGWRASSRQFKIAALPPGAVREETLDLIVPPSESEHPVDLKFGLRFDVRGKELSVQLPKRLALQSPIRIESAVSPSNSLVVRILNGSDRAMTLSIRSRVPGLAERLDLVRELAPGSRSKALEFPVRESGSAEIYVQEAGGDRAIARRLIPLP